MSAEKTIPERVEPWLRMFRTGLLLIVAVLGGVVWLTTIYLDVQSLKESTDPIPQMREDIASIKRHLGIEEIAEDNHPPYAYFSQQTR